MMHYLGIAAGVIAAIIAINIIVVIEVISRAYRQDNEDHRIDG